MESCFSVTNAFWGIDKVVLSLKGQFHINNQELDLAASMKNNFSITKKYDKLGTISELDIKSSTFGSFLWEKSV